MRRQNTNRNRLNNHRAIVRSHTDNTSFVSPSVRDKGSPTPFSVLRRLVCSNRLLLAVCAPAGTGTKKQPKERRKRRGRDDRDDAAKSRTGFRRGNSTHGLIGPRESPRAAGKHEKRTPSTLCLPLPLSLSLFRSTLFSLTLFLSPTFSLSRSPQSSSFHGQFCRLVQTTG